MAAAVEMYPLAGVALPWLATERTNTAEWQELKIGLHSRLGERLSPEQVSSLSQRSKREVQEAIAALIQQDHPYLGAADRERLLEETVEEVFGLGPLEPLMKDPTVSDILVTTAKMVYVERGGRLHETSVEFANDAHLLRIIEKIVSRVGRRIDADSPMVDARLPDGSRVNAVIPPVAVDGPALSIRRFGKDRLTAEALVQNLSMTNGMLELMKACVAARLNIIVSGGTGAGKTTLLNILSGYIGGNERIVSIEDSAELQLRQRHVVRMETRPANVDGENAIHMRQLLINSLRMRPDRIIVGEVRGAEALDMLQAMNTGHDGSLTTLHANSPREAISRLEVMVGMANSSVPLRAVRQQISSAVDLFVQVSRLSDGSRRITHITECCGMEGDLVTMQDLYVFEKNGIGEDGRVKGRSRPTGIRPKFSERLVAIGVQLPPSLFQTIVEIQ